MVYAETHRALLTFLLEVIVERGEELPGELGIGRVVCVCEELNPRIRTHEVKISSQPGRGEKLIIGLACGQHRPGRHLVVLRVELGLQARALTTCTLGLAQNSIHHDALKNFNIKP